MSGDNGMAMELGVRNVSGLVANLHAADEQLVRDLKRLAQRGAREVHELADKLCARDTGFMADHLAETFTPSGLAFEVGWLAEDFYSAGFEFYPWFVEFGTRYMDAQPALGPAADQIFPQYREDVSNLIRASIARLGAY
jgi:HK97 gp10 family phage protein